MASHQSRCRWCVHHVVDCGNSVQSRGACYLASHRQSPLSLIQAVSQCVAKRPHSPCARGNNPSSPRSDLPSGDVASDAHWACCGSHFTQRAAARHHCETAHADEIGAVLRDLVLSSVLANTADATSILTINKRSSPGCEEGEEGRRICRLCGGEVVDVGVNTGSPSAPEQTAPHDTDGPASGAATEGSHAETECASGAGASIPHPSDSVQTHSGYDTRGPCACDRTKWVREDFPSSWPMPSSEEARAATEWESGQKSGVFDCAFLASCGLLACFSVPLPSVKCAHVASPFAVRWICACVDWRCFAGFFCVVRQ